MARTASTPKPLTYAISYGFSGGPLHGRGLAKRLKAAKLVRTRIEAADIIIAHSAGCWLIPKTAKPRLVIYVGIPLSQTRPSRTFLHAQRDNSRHNKLSSNLKGRMISTYYFLKQPRHNFNIVKMAREAKPIIFPRADTVFIANRYDPWQQPDVLESYLNRYNWSFISMEGAHADIGMHPERYAEIIEHYAGLLG